MIVTDHINKLEAVVTYNPQKKEKKGMLKNLFKKKTDSEA